MSQSLPSRSRNLGGASRAESSAEGYTLDAAMIARPENMDVQLDLLLDYASNVRLYPAFQRYFRERQPPFLAMWGKHNPFFIPAGAAAFRNDIRDARVITLPVRDVHPERRIYASFIDFADPDGNTWIIQERGFTRTASNDRRI
jgi:hypothetical protein